MTDAFIERRKCPRYAVLGRARLDRTTALSVRVLDIGLGGVLVASSHLMDVGQFGRLSMRLGDVIVDTDIEIRRVGAQRDDKGAYKLGARFVGLDAATRAAMQLFLSSAKH